MAGAKPDVDEPVLDETVVAGQVPADLGVSCNLPGCEITDDLTRGLCPAHWCSHRGLAAPLPDEEVP